MSIVSPARGSWRAPTDGQPTVEVDVTRFGDGDVTIRFGAGSANVVAALARLPVGALFVGACGDTEVTLVFRTFPETEDSESVPAAEPRQAA